MDCGRIRSCVLIRFRRASPSLSPPHGRSMSRGRLPTARQSFIQGDIPRRSRPRAALFTATTCALWKRGFRGPLQSCRAATPNSRLAAASDPWDWASRYPTPLLDHPRSSPNGFIRGEPLALSMANSQSRFSARATVGPCSIVSTSPQPVASSIMKQSVRWRLRSSAFAMHPRPI